MAALNSQGGRGGRGTLWSNIRGGGGGGLARRLSQNTQNIYQKQQYYKTPKSHPLFK